MVSSSKILTVSYGTFSCTAEGFDDPLDVVKEATHFFRGVVGEDRFFGAEPPQFDPELASEYLRDRLAESGGTLSLGSPPRVMAAAASAGAMATAFSSPAQGERAEDTLPDDNTIEATAVLSERQVSEDDGLSHQGALDIPAPDGAEVAPAPQTSAPEDISAKLERIRAVVARTGVDPDAQQPEAQAPIEDEAAPEREAPPAEASDAVPEPFEEPVAAWAERFEAPEEPWQTAEAWPAEEEQATDEALAEIDEEPDEDPDDGLESMLDEFVVESGDTEEIDFEATLDGEGADRSDETSEEDAFDTALDDLRAEQHEDDAPDAAQAGEDAETQDDGAAAAAVAALVSGTAGADRAEQQDRAEAAEDGGSLDDETTGEDLPDEDWTAEAAPWTGHDEDMGPDAETPATPVRARVVKVKRAAFEQAVGEGALEEILDETPAPESTGPDPEDSSLTPEEEEELARELAAVKAELASDFGAWDEDLDRDFDGTPEPGEGSRIAAATRAPEDGSEPLRLDNPILTPDRAWQTHPDAEPEEGVLDDARKAVKLASPARVLLTEREVEDDDTSRLLDQTNTEMDEPEGNRRRSAIAHLRAAVAATKADGLLGRKSDAAEEQEPYREDLASVVRPRRPQSTTHHTERPTPVDAHHDTDDDAAASPLKLVAEQRIARQGEPGSAGPVRPRRVRRSTPAETPGTQSGEPNGFGAYARDVGAKDLPELLEAAAAYMSYVEGLDQFSRPQLMTTLRQAELTDSSREDRLRSFGQLLREGKIRKTSGGRFTAAETISFKPAANG